MRDVQKIGLVGTGAIAQAYIKALEDCDFAKLTAVADVRRDAAIAAAETANCKWYESHQALADSGECSAVILCTPPVTHKEIALYFLDRKIPVLCEKPLSIDRDSAKAIIERAAENNVLLTMASKFRYVEDIIRAKSIIVSGLLGDILLMENAFTSRVDMSNRWNSNADVSGGGVVIDNGTHSVDIIRYLLGPIADIMFVECTRSPGFAVEDNAFLFARTAGGVSARVDLSWSFDKQLANFVSLYGTHGTIQVGWKESRYKQHGSSDWIVFGGGYDKFVAFRRQLENFCRAVTSEESPLVSLEDAYASVDVIQAAYESRDKGEWVRVTESRGLADLGNKRPSVDAAE